MSVTIMLNKKTFYVSTQQKHAEELMFKSGLHLVGNITFEIDAWPCMNEKHHNCHDLLLKQSANRTITVSVTADSGGYAKTHGQDYGDTGTITYTKGVATYSNIVKKAKK